MKYVNFEGADLQGMGFLGCDLEGANFRGANIGRCKFIACDLTDVNFAETVGESRRGPSLEMRKARVGPTSKDLSLFKPGADLRYADLRKVNLEGLDLSGADLSYSHLTNVELHDCNLQDAKLRCVAFNDVSLSSDCRRADFRGSSFAYSRGNWFIDGANARGCSFITCTFRALDTISSSLLDQIDPHRTSSLDHLDGIIGDPSTTNFEYIFADNLTTARYSPGIFWINQSVQKVRRPQGVSLKSI